MTIRTPRLELIPATPDLARADLRGREALAAALGVEVPAAWPPDLYDRGAIEWFLRAMEAEPDPGPWTYHYFARRPEGASAPAALVGVGGYKGPPAADGGVEIGYSILEEHRRQGYATEAVEGFVRQAFEDPRVTSVLAETLPGLFPSIGVLRKAGFRYVGRGAEEGAIRYELLRAAVEPVRLATPRLALRRLGLEDLEAFLDYRNDPEVARYQSWESFARADAEALLQEQAAVRPGEPGRWLQLAIERRERPGLLGDCGFCVRAENVRHAEIGFSLAREHQGKGYATEALAAVLGYLFRELRIERVVAVTDSRNRRSEALLERLGLRRDSTVKVWFKGAPGEEHRFALDRDDWLARQSISS